MQYIGTRFVQTPRYPVESPKMHNAIWSRVHQISARDRFPGIVPCQKDVFVASQLYSSNTLESTFRGTAVIAHRIHYCNPQITVTALIVH